MSKRFIGEHYCRLDQQGRLMLPLSYRDVLQAHDPDFHEGSRARAICVFPENRPYLEFYKILDFNEISEKISRMPRGSRERMLLQRIYHGQSESISLDKRGRLTIPKPLQNRRSFWPMTNIMLIAQGDAFQMWLKKDLDKHRADELDWLDELPDDFNPLSFLDEST